MKTTIQYITIAFAMLCATHATAQKGTWIIDANGSYDKQILSSGNGTPSYSLQNWSAEVAGGRQFTKNLTAGLAVAAETQQSIEALFINKYMPPHYNSYMQNTLISSTTLKVGAWFRYTHWLGNRFFLYSQVNTMVELRSWDSDTPLDYYYTLPFPQTNTSNYNAPAEGFSVYAFPAIGMNVINGLGIHADVGGISYTNYEDGGSAQHYEHINVNFAKQFHFGVHKIIEWKKTHDKAENANVIVK